MQSLSTEKTTSIHNNKIYRCFIRRYKKGTYNKRIICATAGEIATYNIAKTMVQRVEKCSNVIREERLYEKFQVTIIKING